MQYYFSSWHQYFFAAQYKIFRIFTAFFTIFRLCCQAAAQHIVFLLAQCLFLLFATQNNAKAKVHRRFFWV